MSQLADDSRQLIHCRVFGWHAGDCGKLHCSRCGETAYRSVANRIIRATLHHAKIYFVTVYYARKRASLAELPLFEFSPRDEQTFRKIISKILAALRKKAIRHGAKLEYVAVLAFGRVNHRIHKKIHCHILLTWLFQPAPKVSKSYPNRLECPWLSQKATSLGMDVWIENPHSRLAVSRYTAANLKTVIGKPEMKNIHAFRFSQGYENDHAQ